MRKKYDFLQYKVNFLHDRVNELKAEKKLLKEHIEQLVVENYDLLYLMETLKAGLPHPCDNDGTFDVSAYSLRDWQAKLREELIEIEHEIDMIGGGFGIYHFDKNINNKKVGKAINRLSEEITDLSTVCASFLNWLGWNIYGRAKLQKEVNEKNKNRGYY